MEQASSSNPAASEKNNDVDDRISELPDDMLSHILAFLNMEEAVGTRMLSHRWRYLCVSKSNLELDSSFIFGFDHELMDEDDEYDSILSSLKGKFVERVDQFLNIVAVQKPLTLKVRYPLGQEAASHIDDWINFAVRRECEQIELDFNISWHLHGDYYGLYNFPCHLLTLREKSPLKLLLLKDCIFKPPPELANRLNCLKSLTLENVPVEPSDLEIILSGCLNIEQLELTDCQLLSTVHICVQNLRLKWLLVRFLPIVQKVELSAPNLEVFKYEGVLPNFTLSRFHQLKEVSLMIYWNKQRCWNQMLHELARNVPHLQMLSLTWLDQSNNFADIKDLKTKFYKLTHLELTFGTGDYNWNLFTYLLYRSPHLKVLIIDKDDVSPPNVDVDDVPIQTQHSKPVPGFISTCMPPCISRLRKVCFRQFHGGDCEVAFVRFILKNARALENMTITILGASWLTTLTKIKIIHKISAFPIRSAKCQVLFNGDLPGYPSPFSLRIGAPR